MSTVIEQIDSAASIQIGPVRLAQLNDGLWWLEHDNGEGTQVSNEEMFVLMEKLFREVM